MFLEKIKCFDDIIRLKENKNIEFKEATSNLGSSFWETYSSFANTEGGIIILGVKEGKVENKIVGVDSIEKLIQEITTTANNQTKVNNNVLDNSKIKVISEENINVLLIEIPMSKYHYKPIYLKGNPKNSYKRVHESDQLCSPQELAAMLRDSSVESLDEKILEHYSEEDLDIITLEKYRLNMKEVNPDSAFNRIVNMKDFLLTTGILKRDRDNKKIGLTLGGLLMFGKRTSIKSYLPHFHLEYINISNPDNQRWTDRIIFDTTWGEENIYNFYNTVINKLDGMIMTPFKLKADSITRDDSNEFKVAVREAFLNTLIHADYEYPFGIYITKKEKEYVFENPGMLRLSPEEILSGVEHSQPRNSLIMDLFRFVKLSERAGTGIRTILHVINEYGLQKPSIESEKGKVKFILPDSKILDNDDLNEKEKIIVAFILEKKKIKNSDIQNLLNTDKDGAFWLLNKLVSKDYIKKNGVGKGMFYTLVNYPPLKI